MTTNELKYLSKLLIKKFRIESQQYLIEGEKLVSEALNSNAVVNKIFVEKSLTEKFKSLITIASKLNIEVDFIKGNDLSKICDSKTPQGIAALLSITKKMLQFEDFIVAIENVQDPGNAGTIIRTCDWFGIKQIILSNDSVEIYNPKLIRATMGSVFHLNIFESNDFYDDLISLVRKGYKLICADLNGNDINEMKLSRKTIIVFCNESNGPSRKLLELNPEKVTIKKFGMAESLNVASAAAVILSNYAYRRA